MKTKRPVQPAALVLLLSTLNAQLSTCFAQGTLAPPGAPAPTMKTLTQVEPRTAITNSGAVTIFQPGSYYLTTNIAVNSGDAVTITTNGVKLDLNGFTISSTEVSPAGTGIMLSSGLRNITIANGFIQGGVTNNGGGVYSGSGFAYGIYYSGTPPVNVQVSRVSVSGCLYHGIYLNSFDSTVVESCTVRNAGSYGILAAIIRSSAAIQCGDDAIHGEQVSDCEGEVEGTGYGIYAFGAQNCYGVSVHGPGVNAFTAQNCYGYGLANDNSYSGLYAENALNCSGSSNGSGVGVFAATALNCSGSSNSGDGVYANTALNCYGSSGSGDGVHVGYSAQNCIGGSNSGDGVHAFAMHNCYGWSQSAYGVYAYDLASLSYGFSTSGTGLRAFIANSCDGGGSPPLDVAHKYDMP